MTKTWTSNFNPTGTKTLYKWSWSEGGFNQCYAASKREARKIGNAMTSKLSIDEKTFRRVKDVAGYWDAIPPLD